MWLLYQTIVYSVRYFSGNQFKWWAQNPKRIMLHEAVVKRSGLALLYIPCSCLGSYSGRFSVSICCYRSRRDASLKSPFCKSQVNGSSCIVMLVSYAHCSHRSVRVHELLSAYTDYLLEYLKVRKWAWNEPARWAETHCAVGRPLGHPGYSLWLPGWLVNRCWLRCPLNWLLIDQGLPLQNNLCIPTVSAVAVSLSLGNLKYRINKCILYFDICPCEYLYWYTQYRVTVGFLLYSFV